MSMHIDLNLTPECGTNGCHHKCQVLGCRNDYHGFCEEQIALHSGRLTSQISSSLWIKKYGSQHHNAEIMASKKRSHQPYIEQLLSKTA